MNVSALISVLPLIGEGMLGVFAVIIVIWLSIAAMSKFLR